MGSAVSGQTVWDLGAPEVLTAVSRVRAGRVFDLAVDMSRDMPQGPRDTFPRFSLSPFRIPKSVTSPEEAPAFDFSMETISGSLHAGTHMDGLAHIHCAGHMGGGASSREHFTDFGWSANGVEQVPPIITRGVLLDVAGRLGVQSLDPGFEIRPEHLQLCLQDESIEIRPGDAVLVRTGFIAKFHAGDEGYFSPAPGVGRDGALWLYERGMAALGTDTSGTEPQPMADPSLSTHQALLVDRSVLLFEILDLDELAAQRVYEFLFVCLPLRLVGATGSWVRPVAVV